MVYKKWLKEWLDIYIKTSYKYTTYCTYKREVNLRINSGLGNFSIEKIKEKDIQMFINKVTERGKINSDGEISNSHINLIIAIILASIKKYYIVHNKTNKQSLYVKRAPHIQKEIRALAEKSEEKLVKYILDNKKIKYYGYLISIFTGLRLGELLALQWSDIDYQNRIIRVNKTRIRGKDCNGNNIDIVSSPKSLSSNRLIPLTGFIARLLKEIKENSVGPYVISYRGKYKCIRSYQKSFKCLLRKLGIEDNCFHSTRHTFATRLLDSRQNPLIPSKIMGHSNPTITLNKYNTWFIEGARKSLETITNKYIIHKKKHTHNNVLCDQLEYIKT